MHNNNLVLYDYIKNKTIKYYDLTSYNAHQIILDENKCTIDQVHEAVAKVGHDTEKVKASDEPYDNLHGCCKFERKE